MPRPELSNDKQIQAFMHCGVCLREERPQNIEAGWTELGFQVWCRNHDVNIIHVDFQGFRHPADTTRKRLPSDPEPAPKDPEAEVTPPKH